MSATPLPALPSGEPTAWDLAIYAFLVEKGNRSGSGRTVESYSRLLWPFFGAAGKPPDEIRPPDVLAYAHGIGASGRPPSGATIGARIACFDPCTSAVAARSPSQADTNVAMPIAAISIMATGPDDHRFQIIAGR